MIKLVNVNKYFYRAEPREVHALKDINLSIQSGEFTALAGFILGLVLGLLFLAYLKYHGLDLSVFASGMSMFGLDSTIYAVIKPSYFVSTFFAIVTASLLSIFLPLRKIKRLDPIEVIRSIG